MEISAVESCMMVNASSMADLIAQVVTEDAASIPAFDTTYLNLLLDDASTLSFREARPEVKIKDSVVVRQDFDLCDEIPTKSAFWNCTAMLERCLNEALSLMTPCPLVPPLWLNDLIVQRYHPGSHGISPHRDHIKYRGLIVLLVLCGHGRYHVCTDREGNNAREIFAPPGHIILMRAPDFASRSDRPFHFLTDVTSQRFSFGIRYDSTT